MYLTLSSLRGSCVDCKAFSIIRVYCARAFDGGIQLSRQLVQPKLLTLTVSAAAKDLEAETLPPRIGLMHRSPALVGIIRGYSLGSYILSQVE